MFVAKEETTATNPDTKTCDDDELLRKLDEHFRDPYTKTCRESGYKRIPEKLLLMPFVWFFCTYQVNILTYLEEFLEDYA